MALSGPILPGIQDWHDFKINQIRPTVNPRLERVPVLRLHDLKAPGGCRVDPAPTVNDAFWQHPAVMSKAFSGGFGITTLEMFDHHKEHEWEYTRTLRDLKPP